jgi:hypothetical protein
MAEPIILDANITPLKKQLKDATQELQIARQRFGDLSTEAVEAAKKVAGIRDSIAAANEQAALFDPGKRFQALTSAASLAAGAVGAVQGAMGLFGAESEETQKALLKVQSAMALSQGLSQLADLSKVTEELKSSFKGLVGTTAQKTAATASDTAAVAANAVANKGQAAATNASTLASRAAAISLKVLRGALIGLGIPALILGLVALVQNFDKIKSVVLNFIPGLGQLADFFGNLVTKVTDFVGVTSQANRELEKLAKTTSRSNEDITARINLLTAQGGKEKEIFELKKKQSENELNVLRATLKTKGTLTDEEEKQFRDLKNNQLVEQAAYDKKQADELKSANEKQEQEAKSAADKARANQEQVNAKKLEAQKILADAQNSLLTEREQQAAAIEATFQEQSKKLKEAGIKDDGTLEEVRRKALAEIDKKFNDEKEAKDKAFQERLNDILTESRLAGIKDENERARAELLVQQEQKLADLATDTTLEADQKLALQKQLEIRNKQELDALEMTFAEEEAMRNLAELDEEMKQADASFAIQRNLLDQKDALLKEQLEMGILTEKAFTQAVKENSDARVKIDQAEVSAKLENAGKIAGLLSGLSNLIGKETAAGKGFAVASATIDTYLSAQKAYQSMVGIPVAGPALAAVAAGVAIAGGIKNVREIVRTKVPGGGGGVSAPNIAASAPSVTSAVPTLGTSPVTALGTMMQNQPPLRAFVVESEVTNSQKRVADIERRAGF